MTNIINQAKASFEFCINSNHSPEKRVKHLQMILLMHKIEGFEMALKVYRNYTPIGHSPAYDEMLAKLTELKLSRSNLA